MKREFSVSKLINVDGVRTAIISVRLSAEGEWVFIGTLSERIMVDAHRTSEQHLMWVVSLEAANLLGFRKRRNQDSYVMDESGRLFFSYEAAREAVMEAD